MHLRGFFHALLTFDTLKFLVPTAISVVALFITLRDRRPHLVLRPRKGEWYTLTKTIGPNGVIFRGVAEVYNASARANAVRDYAFRYRRQDGEWEAMESEYYADSVDGETSTPNNVTPLALAPYSGIARQDKRGGSSSHYVGYK